MNKTKQTAPEITEPRSIGEIARELQIIADRFVEIKADLAVRDWLINTPLPNYGSQDEAQTEPTEG